MIGRGLLVAAILLSGLAVPERARAQVPEDDGVSYPTLPEDRQRHPAFQIGAGAVSLATFPRSLGDGGPLLQGAYIFLRRAGRNFEFTLDAAAQLAVGVLGPGLHLGIGPRAGVGLNLGWFGVEMKMGVAGLAQFAERSVGGIALWGEGGYVVRFGEALRQRAKLLVTFRTGAYLAADPGNDLGPNAMGMGLLLAYEWPFPAIEP